MITEKNDHYVHQRWATHIHVCSCCTHSPQATKDSESFKDVWWAHLHKILLPRAQTENLKKDKVLPLRSNLLTLERNGLTCFWSRTLHRTCPRWQFQRWYMKLTAPAFDKLLHSLWIQKRELEWKLAWLSRHNLHPCIFELVGAFQSQVFLFLSSIGKHEDITTIQCLCNGLQDSCYFFVSAWLNRTHVWISQLWILSKEFSWL